MKKVKILLLVVIVSLLFSGCSSFRISSIDDLISPVAPSGENADILEAVDAFCKGGYSIKIPSGGDYTTSFISRDLDGDGENEAIAFFEPADSIGTVVMAVIEKTEDGCKVVNDITGEGADVNAVDFSDVNDDGREEIIVCWSVLSNSTTSNLCVYSIDDSLSLSVVANGITAGDFISVDINDNGVNELLVFTFGSTTLSPKAELYSFTGNKKHSLGETKLDSTIISFSNITCAPSDEGMSVYADAVCSGGDKMITELLYWSNYYDSVISPFYSYSTGRTADTARSNMITCRDIDGDGEVEIPVDKSASGIPEQIDAQNWVAYKNTVLIHKAYSFACKTDGYIIRLNDDDFSKARLSYDADKRELTVSDGKADAFKILTVIKSGYNSEEYSDYTEILSDSGFVYLARIYDGSQINITVDDLKDCIKPY